MSQNQHLSDYLRVLYKRRWTAALVFLLVFAYGAATSLRKTPVYEAGAQLLIEKESRRANTLNTVLQDNDSWYDDDFYQTQYRMLQSRALAWRTLELMGMTQAPPEAERMAAATEREGKSLLERVALLMGAPEKIEPPAGDETSWQSEQIDGFLYGVRVEPVRNSRLANVKYRSPDPVFAAQAANRLAEAYIQQGLRARSLASQDANQFLTEQLKEQKAKLDESERALQAYKERYGAIAITDPQNNIIVRKLADISAELTRARNERLEKEALLKTLNELAKDPAKLDTFPAIRADETIQRLRSEIAEARNRDAQLVALGRGPMWVERREIAASLETKEAQLQSQVGKVVESVRNEFTMAQSREAALQGQLDAQKRESLSQDSVAIEYTALERDMIGNRQLYENLLQRAKETGVTGEYKGTSVQIVDAAEVPRVPVLPNYRRDLLFALMAGLVLSVGLAFGLEYLDSRIKTPDDIKAHLAIPFLGLVPTISAKHHDGVAPLLDKGVPPAFAEAMRAIRTSVIFSSAADSARSVMVTSTAPSEGKTLVSSNLADALAQAEQRTLLVDSDMRRPRIHEVFGFDQEPGLSNVLVGTVQLHSAIRKTNNPYLSVLPAGHLPPNPAELLGSPRCRRLLDQLGQEFDWIIMDAPPVMAVTDAAVIAHDVSGVVFVVGAEMTPRRNAQTALEQLTAARAKVIGAVLNRVNVERHSYYYAPYHRKDYTRAYVRSQ